MWQSWIGRERCTQVGQAATAPRRAGPRRGPWMPCDDTCRLLLGRISAALIYKEFKRGSGDNMQPRCFIAAAFCVLAVAAFAVRGCDRVRVRSAPSRLPLKSRRRREEAGGGRIEEKEIRGEEIQVEGRVEAGAGRKSRAANSNRQAGLHRRRSGVLRRGRSDLQANEAVHPAGIHPRDLEAQRAVRRGGVRPGEDQPRLDG